MALIHTRWGAVCSTRVEKLLESKGWHRTSLGSTRWVPSVGTTYWNDYIYDWGHPEYGMSAQFILYSRCSIGRELRVELGLPESANAL
jgi:hypothetical protein